MKKTENVSIGGFAFILEADAAAAADAYLKDIAAFYTNQEISDGIEERMAELLRERIPTGGVGNKAIIDSVIEILGRPERIAEDQPDSPDPEKPAKKLYRDVDNARLAGVCSGLGAYFKFDPVILRVIFAVLTIAGFAGFADKSGVISFSIPLVYIILWICIPAARTAQQRWALRGEDGSAEGVRRSIEKGASDMGNALRQVGNSTAWAPIWRVLEVIMGILLLIISVSGLFAGALAIFGWQWLGLGTVLTDAITDLTIEFPEASVVANTFWVQILAAAVYFLPFIGMLYSSIMMLFRIKSPSWKPGLVIFILWLISVVAFGILTGACLFSAATAC
ncbi:MAG: PspC domain-containing protein [Bacteroidales bacterium]|nr:PspC domain-containing protein [Bacteroidales bacterium]